MAVTIASHTAGLWTASRNSRWSNVLLPSVSMTSNTSRSLSSWNRRFRVASRCALWSAFSRSSYRRRSRSSRSRSSSPAAALLTKRSSHKVSAARKRTKSTSPASGPLFSRSARASARSTLRAVISGVAVSRGTVTLHTPLLSVSWGTT